MLSRTKLCSILVLVIAFYLPDQTTTKEEQFKTTVQKVIDGFSKQDSLKVAKYIDKKTGVYLLHRVGVFDTYHHTKTITFSDSTYPAILFKQSKGIKHAYLIYSNLPNYDCGKETWSKNGLFVDTTKIDHLVSKTCKSRNEYRHDTISAATIQFFYNLENKSRRIVLYDSNESELVFYLSYLNGNWYLTIIDTVTSDCSV